MTTEMQRIAFLVHGHVQGVFFRVFTQRSARAHNLTGFVRNTSAGKVAGEAQGARGDVAGFVKELDRGSEGSRVVCVFTLMGGFGFGRSALF